MPAPLDSGDAFQTPTPDPVREEPEIRSEPVYHVVQYGDTLQKIARIYNITVDAIMGNDFSTLRTMVYIGSLFFIGGQIVTDVSYTLVDPRIRLE